MATLYRIRKVKKKDMSVVGYLSVNGTSWVSIGSKKKLKDFTEKDAIDFVQSMVHDKEHYYFRTTTL